ncbi:MAG: shikimate kinase [Caldivirga sp.]|uniref:shikimate kinase n=1 Tax=Caldivirga sp. MU80 TaxID=1650354 RepID=UPI00083768F9|nr:shikimate kinase [Caldivirga sp. MU80]
MEYVTYGGVSIINAIPALRGGVMAIDLPVRVELTNGRCVMDEFTSFILNYASRRLNVNGEYCARVNSSVPVSSGLKSNSAVAAGIVYALAMLSGVGLSEVDAARIAAEATRAHGSSITGAFDDASASLLRGIVLTDNRLMKVVRHLKPPGDVTVVVTGFKERKRPINVNELRRLASIYIDLFHWALNGEIWHAATVNGIMVARALGYDGQLKAIGEALSNGALAAGVSGNGPSVFAVFKDGEEGPYVEYVDRQWGYLILARPVA